MTDQTIKDLGSIADNSRLESIKQLARGFADSFKQREGDKTLLEWRNDLSLYGTSSSMLSDDEKRVLLGMLDSLKELHTREICHGNINESCILISQCEVKMIDAVFLEFSDDNVERDYLDLAKVIRQFRRKLPAEVDHLVNYLCKKDKGVSSRLKSTVYIFNPPCTWSMQRISMVIDYLANQRNRLVRNRKRVLDEAILSASGSDWKENARKSTLLSGINIAGPCILQFMRDVYGHPPCDDKGNSLDDIDVTKLFNDVFPNLIATLILDLAEKRIVVPGDFIYIHPVGTTSFYSAKIPY